MLDLGAMYLGGMPAWGRVVGLRATVAVREVAVSWAHEGPNPEHAGVRYAVHLDGLAIAEEDAPPAGIALEELEPGAHSLSVSILAPGAELEQLLAGAAGNRVRLAWERPDAADLAGFVLTPDGEDPIELDADEDTWLSGELAAGLQEFDLVAVDEAGNESAAASIAIRTFPAPVDPEGIAASWDGADIALSWSLGADASRDAVLLYANQNAATGLLEEQVIESQPWAVLAAGATGHSFTPAASGLWRFIARARHTGGRIGRSIEAADVDTAGPPTGVALNEPAGLEVVPRAGGKLLVRWLYAMDGGEDLEEFRVYREFDLDTPVATIPATAAGSFGADEHEWLSDVEASATSFLVRAAGGGAETANEDWAEGTPDDDAPDAPVLSGVSA